MITAGSNPHPQERLSGTVTWWIPRAMLPGSRAHCIDADRVALVELFNQSFLTKTIYVLPRPEMGKATDEPTPAHGPAAA